MRPAGQHSPHLSPFSSHPGDHHSVVARRRVTQPGNDRSFGPLINGYPLCPGHRAAAHRSSKIGDEFRQLISKSRVATVKRQEGLHRTREVLDVFRLSLLTSASVSFLPLRKAGSRPLGFQVLANSRNGRRRRINTARKQFATLLLHNYPMLAGRFNSPSQSRIARRQQSPTVRNRDNPAISRLHRARRRPRRKNVSVVTHHLAL